MRKLCDVLLGLAALYLLLVLIHLRSLQIQKRTIEDFALNYVADLHGDGTSSVHDELTAALVAYDRAQRVTVLLLKSVISNRELILQAEHELVQLGCEEAGRQELHSPLPQELPSWRALLRSSGVTEIEEQLQFVRNKEAAALRMRGELAEMFKKEAVEFHVRHLRLTHVLQGHKCL